MKRFSLRILLPTLLTLLLFLLSIFLIIIPRYKVTIMDGKREMIKELTNSAWSILLKYENDEKAGVLTREDAQATAASRIQYLRYGTESKDYFWITDTTPRMIMHPFRHDLNGKDVSDFRDPHGKRMFVAFVDTVIKSDHGYVDYMWQWKDDSLKIVPKLSYVKIFKPWNWVIGTGIYIEDAKKEVITLTQNLVWLSIGISIIIAGLLFFILQQSLTIEQKRRIAENELHESRERYRSLVEASTEGLLMLVDGKISFFNSAISRMTGFGRHELENKEIAGIIHLKFNDNDTFNEGTFEASLVKKDGGLIETLVTATTSDFLGKSVQIVIVKDVSAESTPQLSNLEYQKLINSMNLGFFRANLDYKGKFLYANENALRILGFNTTDELAKTSILELLADTGDRKNLRKNLLKSGLLKNVIIPIRKKDAEPVFLALTLVASKDNNEGPLICDGIFEDITNREKEKGLNDRLIAGLQLPGILLDQPVKQFLAPAVSVDADASLFEVIRLMKVNETQAVLVTKNNNDYLGIITGSDIQNRILPLSLHLDNPAYMVMSSPVVSALETSSVFDTITLCAENKISHLVIKNNENTVTGIVSMSTVFSSLFHTHGFLQRMVKKSESVKDLHEVYRMLQKLVKSLLTYEASVQVITSITSAFSDAVISRVIELAQQDLGPAPAKFAFICLGSEGRKEETLFTDQDNAIVYDNVAETLKETAEKYFIKLGEKVCESLNHIGYVYCKGRIMANNPQWNQPLSSWEKYFSTWIAAPEPQHLLDAIIFFDFRCVYGETLLTEKLWQTIALQVANKPVFFYHLALNTCQIKPVQIQSGGIIPEKTSDRVDLKMAVLPIVMFARTYSIRNNLGVTNTLERLEALKERGIMNPAILNEMVFAFNYLMKLRFRNQAALLDTNAPLSNYLSTKTLTETEVFLFKKVLSTLPDFQEKIKTDFRVAG